MRRIAFAVLASLVLLVATAVPAIGTAADKTPVEGVVVYGEYQDPGTEWYSGTPTNFVWHLRGAQSTEWVEGSEHVQGQLASTINLNAHFSCGVGFVDCELVGGALWVTFRWELDAFEGGWEGSGAAKFTGMLPDGRLLYEGTGQASGWGELDGWHLHDSVEVDPETGIKHYTGYVFSTGK